MNEDKKVSQRYRELGTEEPPRHVDEAILAAARRAVPMHPAPLVPPTGRRRWYYPVAAAAIIVLAVAVTVHVERERPDPESAVLMRAPQPMQEPAREHKQTEESRTDSAPRQKREVQPAAPADKAFAADPPQAARDEMKPQAAPPPPPEVAASQAESRARESAPIAGARAPEAPRAEALFRKQLAEEPPEKVLERIVELRKAGKHEEADKALEEFRKRYPDYKLPEAVLKK